MLSTTVHLNFQASSTSFASLGPAPLGVIFFSPGRPRCTPAQCYALSALGQRGAGKFGEATMSSMFDLGGHPSQFTCVPWQDKGAYPNEAFVCSNVHCLCLCLCLLLVLVLVLVLVCVCVCLLARYPLQLRPKESEKEATIFLPLF